MIIHPAPGNLVIQDSQAAIVILLLLKDLDNIGTRLHPELVRIRQEEGRPAHTVQSLPRQSLHAPGKQQPYLHNNELRLASINKGEQHRLEIVVAPALQTS